MVVSPGREIFFCYCATYEGPDASVVVFHPGLTGGFLHHTLLNQVKDDEFPDGPQSSSRAPQAAEVPLLLACPLHMEPATPVWRTQ